VCVCLRHDVNVQLIPGTFRGAGTFSGASFPLRSIYWGVAPPLLHRVHPWLKLLLRFLLNVAVNDVAEIVQCYQIYTISTISRGLYLVLSA